MVVVVVLSVVFKLIVLSESIVILIINLSCMLSADLTLFPSRIQLPSRNGNPLSRFNWACVRGKKKIWNFDFCLTFKMKQLNFAQAVYFVQENYSQHYRY